MIMQTYTQFTNCEMRIVFLKSLEVIHPEYWILLYNYIHTYIHTNICKQISFVTFRVNIQTCIAFIYFVHFNAE